MNTPEEGVHPGDKEDAAKKMKGWDGRIFIAEMTLKYCNGNSRKGESLFGWGRETIETGLGEKRTGLICVGSQPYASGRGRWEERYPEEAGQLLKMAESHAQQEPEFRTAIAYTRLTAPEARRQLSDQGLSPEAIPSISSMKEILNRSGYRLRKVRHLEKNNIPKMEILR